MAGSELTGPAKLCRVVCVPDRCGTSARRQEARRAPTRKVLERFETVRVTRQRRDGSSSLIHKFLRVYYSSALRYTILLSVALRYRSEHCISVPLRSFFVAMHDRVSSLVIPPGSPRPEKIGVSFTDGSRRCTNTTGPRNFQQRSHTSASFVSVLARSAGILPLPTGLYFRATPTVGPPSI